MDRRRSARISVQLPVQVWGLDACSQAFTASAMVTNLSAGGIVLKSLPRRLKTGEVLDVRMGSSTSQFRVIWIGENGEIGLENLTTEAFLPPGVFVYCAQAAAAC
jgi:hypothetical protein